MIFEILFLIIGSFYGQVYGQNPTPTEQYGLNAILQSPDLFHLYWKADNIQITIELHVKNAKWLLFGISGTTFSDVIVAWMNSDSTGHFSNRILNNGDNNLQTSNYLNAKLVNAFTQNNYTVIKFTRPLQLQCLNPANTFVNIDTGKVNVVFAYGDSVNTDDDSISLTNLNTVSIDLLQSITGIVSCLVPSLPQIFDVVPTGYYVNQVDLIDGIYRLYWNYTNTDFVAEIHVKTLGWVSFGLSPNGGMDGSNVIVGWVWNGSPNFTERFITGRSVIPTSDQNWKMLTYGQRVGVTYFKFTRKLCSSSKTLQMNKGPQQVIFAFGSRAPDAGFDISYHGTTNRGSKELNLLSTGTQNKDLTMADEELLDFKISNVILPSLDTLYYCKGFQVPASLTTKRHIYKWEILFPDYNRANIHHVLLYECSGYTGTPAPTTNICFENTVKSQYCQTISIGWAVGGNSIQVFPQDTGYPIGGDTNYKYFFVEVHYNNPNMNIGYIQSLVLRYHMTKTLRKNELGVLTLGTDASSYGIAIPPGLDSFNLDAYCMNSCLKQKLSSGDITVIAALPHTHLTGIAVSSKIIRNRNDIGYLINNDHYDFNYQQNYFLDPPVNITKDDQLTIRCVYNTKNRTAFTWGGESTRNEMCFNFLLYYPRINDFGLCMTIPYGIDYGVFLNTLPDLGLSLTSVVDQTTFLTALAEATNKLSDPLNVNSAIVNGYIKFFKTSKVLPICGTSTDAATERIAITDYTATQPNVCPISSSTKMYFNPMLNLSIVIFMIIFKIFNYQ